DNKRQNYRFGSTSQYNASEAKDEARKLLNSIAGGADPVAEKQAAKAFKKASESRTLSKYLNGAYWDEHLSARKSGQATKDRITASYEPFLDTDMAKLTPAMLNKHRTDRRNTGIKPQTLNRERVAIHALFVQAIKDKLITSNPADAEHHEKLKEVDAKRVRYLGMKDEHENHPSGERERFTAALESTPAQTQAIVGLCMETGMRRNEIFTLKWDAVSLKNRTVTVHAHFAKADKRRDIGLNDKATAILTKWKRGQGNVTRLDGLVFPSHTGKQLTTIRTTWNTLTRNAQVEDFKFHDIRHDVASRLVMAGVSLYEVAAILGHSDVS
ncbi:MAG: site-specific integrase, partial [Gammaproteobacteria bacterium]|nr:site-specific integrase [Gammaproteobacteria bacterium]